MEDIAIIIQARTGSTRLKNKMIIPFFQGECIFEIVLKRLSHADLSIPIVLATSENPENDTLASMADQYGVNTFRGDENDVLKRFVDAAQNFGYNRIIRVCADNPFLDTAHIKSLIQLSETDPELDYLSLQIEENRPVIKSHIGLFTEYVSLDALKKVILATNDPLYREHVTNFIYTHPGDFSIKLINTPNQVYGRTDIRLTIDTEEDFKLAQYIVTLTQKRPEDIRTEDVLQAIEGHPEILEKMRQQIIENSK